MSSPARVPFPAEIRGELWLTPDGGRPALDRNRLHLLAAAERGEDARDRVEVFRDGPVLDDRMRLADLVVAVRAVEEDRARVDPRIDAQQRHADALEVAARQCPEAAVRVAVLGADAGVEHERPHARDAEDRLLEDDLAARDREVWPQPLEELARLARVRRRHDDARNRREVRRIARPQPCDLRSRPRPIAPRQPQSRERAIRDDVEESKPADPSDFALCRAPEPAARITNDDETSQPQAARQPRREPLP